MAPLPLTSALLTRLPWLSTQGRAVITALACDNGRTRAPDLVAGGSTRQVAFNAAGTVGFVPNEGGWVDFLK